MGRLPGCDTRVTLDAWLDERRRAEPMTVARVPLRAMRGWTLGGAPLALSHDSGRFFSVGGLRVATDFGPVRAWDQPIVHQPEVGILGIITRRGEHGREYLMQAKQEPGNVDGAQISPTLQATFSNYSQAHGGSRPLYLDYFTGRRPARALVDQLQGEQGSRYLRKRNRNVIVEIDDDLEDGERFRWMTLADLSRLLVRPNLVNMDTRTVLACRPRALLAGDARGAFGEALAASAGAGARARHSLDTLRGWIASLQRSHTLTLEPRGLDALAGWRVDDMAIAREDERYFSVIGVSVRGGTREVPLWDQPLVAHEGFGLNGFVLQRIDGTLHFLVRACLYPGNHALFELGSTVSRSNAASYFGTPQAPAYLDLFRDPPASWVRYDQVQSEEGGRFHHYQNRYMLIEVPEDVPVDESPAHRWMTLDQLASFLPDGLVNIEGRNLIACLCAAREPA